MSTAQWILTIALLGWALLRNVGTREVTRSTFVLPLVLVAVASAFFLFPVPSSGNDVGLIVAFGAAGVLLGLAASAATRLQRRDGVVLATAGALFAGLWIAMIAARIAFAEWATGSGAQTVGLFSREHLITGADAWTAAFVVMALGMVLARTLHLIVRTRRLADATA